MDNKTCKGCHKPMSPNKDIVKLSGLESYETTRWDCANCETSRWDSMWEERERREAVTKV